MNNTDASNTMRTPRKSIAYLALSVKLPGGHCELWVQRSFSYDVHADTLPSVDGEWRCGTMQSSNR